MVSYEVLPPIQLTFHYSTAQPPSDKTSGIAKYLGLFSKISLGGARPQTLAPSLAHVVEYHMKADITVD